MLSSIRHDCDCEIFMFDIRSQHMQQHLLSVIQTMNKKTAFVAAPELPKDAPRTSGRSSKVISPSISTFQRLGGAERRFLDLVPRASPVPMQWDPILGR